MSAAASLLSLLFESLALKFSPKLNPLAVWQLNIR